MHDQKVQLDNLQHVKYTLAQQLEEARRRLEDAERVSDDSDDENDDRILLIGQRRSFTLFSGSKQTDTAFIG